MTDSDEWGEGCRASYGGASDVYTAECDRYIAELQHRNDREQAVLDAARRWVNGQRETEQDDLEDLCRAVWALDEADEANEEQPSHTRSRDLGSTDTRRSDGTQSSEQNLQ
jgi:hypothetical protein